MGVPRNRDAYVRGSYLGEFSREPMRRLVDLLSDPSKAGAHGPSFDLRKGTFNRVTREGLNSRVSPLPEFRDRLIAAGLVFHGHPFEPAYISDPCFPLIYLDGQPVHRPLSDLESVLPKVNARLAATEIRFAYPDFSTYRSSWDYRTGQSNAQVKHGPLTRKFKGTETSGGRLYCLNQNIGSAFRPYLEFDGEPTTEFDFKGMEPHMAYSLIGQEAPDPDPYKVPALSFVNRNVFKGCFVIGIGIKHFLSPIPALMEHLRDDYGLLISGTQARLCFDEFWRRHEPIRSFCQTQSWDRLQYSDSQICLAVLSLLEGQGIACLPIHDSFVVPLRHERSLREAMVTATQHLSSPPPVVRVP